MKKCHCIIKHPVTVEERKVVCDNLDYFRRIGDSQGALFCLAQLSGCESLAREGIKS